MGCVWKKAPWGFASTGDPLAAQVGFGERPEGSGGHGGVTPGQLCCVGAPSLARLTLQHGPELRRFQVSLVLWVLPRAEQPLCLLLSWGVEKLQLHPWEPLQSNPTPVGEKLFLVRLFRQQLPQMPHFARKKAKILFNPLVNGESLVRGDL